MAKDLLADQELFNVLGDDIDFEIDLVADLAEAEGGDVLGMGDEGDGKGR